MIEWNAVNGYLFAAFVSSVVLVVLYFVFKRGR